eukprot:2176656-Rhodomonas_salina.2
MLTGPLRVMCAERMRGKFVQPGAFLPTFAMFSWRFVGPDVCSSVVQRTSSSGVWLVMSSGFRTVACSSSPPLFFPVWLRD